MPILNNDSLDQHQIPNSSFGYSATSIDELGATEFTLATILNDVSGSTMGFKDDMESALKEVLKSLVKSPRADNLLIRHVQFDSDIQETHGYKQLQDCDPDDYNGILSIGGMTRLYDAAGNAIRATADYAKKLQDMDYLTNGIVVIITDGDDTASLNGIDFVKQAMQNIVKEESLESLMTILVGVNIQDNFYADRLENFKNETGMTQYVELNDADEKTLAKLAGFVSQSISSQSQALGTGGPSQPLTI